ncbi:MAG: NUDIX domain-containing protein [Candidatus Aenigmarchaeota archaeon]|nr:NUDIX domain-containing protein [Candidatus Aenigmarchaeota archaeon]
MNQNIFPAVKALVIKDNKILLLKKPNSVHKDFDANDIPGGKIEFGETNPIEALRCEVKEETNLDVDVQKPVHVVTIAWSENFHVVGTVFLCTIKNGELKLSDDHEGFLWVAKESILEGNFPSWIKESVKRLE